MTSNKVLTFCSKYDSVRDIRICAITVDEPFLIVRDELCVPSSCCSRLATLVCCPEERSFVGRNSGPDPERVRNLAIYPMVLIWRYEIDKRREDP
ncbi:hypothetical protein IFM47457_04634 [Aspergillus lentulus]|nr:hypothetical protein IFM47457_04634 [Aspergillus lentulus]